ncbi:MAG: flavodoxin family protein [Candidatus Bathyarchaeia archaeon]|jgi:flavodoxin
MKTLVICFSYHHKNTAKIALVFASALNAEIKTPPEVNPNGLSEYDLIGFGSGIYFGKHHKTLLNLADNLPQVTDKKAFIFSTSGRTGNTSKFHKQLRKKLQSKGYTITGEFNCGGLDTYGLMKIVGGVNKERPNKDDIKQAEAFAQSLNQPATVVKS